MTAHADHYRRLACEALNITDPAAQADAALCCVRALLDAASELAVLRQRAACWQSRARAWQRRYAEKARELADAKAGVLSVLDQWFPTALAGTPAPREPVTAYRAAYADVGEGRAR